MWFSVVCTLIDRRHHIGQNVDSRGLVFDYMYLTKTKPVRAVFYLSVEK